MKDFHFFVNEQQERIDRADNSDKLVWTGRLQEGESLSFTIAYSGRGLDQFVYHLDPSLPVYNFEMTSHVTGGHNYDYPEGVVPATAIAFDGNEGITLSWNYQSLESGVPIGLILPSEESFSTIISTMTKRSLATFLLFLVGIHVLAIYYKRPLKFYESYLIFACFAFFYVLLPYFTAFMNFYVAYLLSFVIIASLLYLFVWRTIHSGAGPGTISLLIAFLLVPTSAVIFQGYTGLIYTIEILNGLATAMWLVTKPQTHKLIEHLLFPPPKPSNDATFAESPT